LTLAFTTTISAQTSGNPTSAQLATTSELSKTASSAAVTPTPTPEPDPAITPQTTSSLTNRVKSYDRNEPRREVLTGVRVVKHVNVLFNGFEQGAGFGFGVELTTDNSIPGVEFRLRALTSTRFYARGEAGVYVPKLGSEKSHAEIYYTYLRRTRDRFFGIGPRTPDTFKTNFKSERRSVTGSYYYDLTKRWQVGFYLQRSDTATYRGGDDKDPAIDLLFTGTPNTNQPLRFAPGLMTSPEIFSYGGFTEFDGRENEHGLTRGGYFYARVAGNEGVGTRSKGFGWTDVELDGRGYIPLGSHKTTFAARAYADLKDPHGTDQIPFFSLAVLGGNSYLRGFENYRFRANNLLLFSAELRQTVWKQAETRGVDVIGFGDGGQVWGDKRPNLPLAFRANDDFSSHNWRFGVGFGVAYRFNHAFAVRLDYAHSNEDNKVYFSASRGF
jgi:hypothetical protein